MKNLSLVLRIAWKLQARFIKDGTKLCRTVAWTYTAKWPSKLAKSSEVTPKSFLLRVICLVSVPIQHYLELLSQSIKVHIMIYNITMYIKHKLCHSKTSRYFSLSQCLQRLYAHVSWVVCRKHKEKSRHDLELRSVLWSNLLTECSGRQGTQLGNESAGATPLSHATVN